MPVESTLGQALLDLVLNLWQILGLVLVKLLPYTLLILWAVWWLLAVNWKRAWAVLGEGGWAPLTLLTLVAALVWSRLQPAPCECLGFVSIPNFWWQLGEVSLLVAIALFCGWLQGIMHWAPAELDLNPPAIAHGHDGHHGHGH